MVGMAGRGVYFGLTAEQEQSLLAAASDKDVMSIIEEIEEAWDANWLAEVDKAWDAMHRCLGDGTLDVGEGPLAWAVFGGESKHQGDDYIVSFVAPDEVRQVAQALKGINETWFRERYEALPNADYEGPHGADDFEYTWSNFQDARELFTKAAQAGRAVIFTVDH